MLSGYSSEPCAFRNDRTYSRAAFSSQRRQVDLDEFVRPQEMQVRARHGSSGDLLQRNRVELKLQTVRVYTARVNRLPELVGLVVDQDQLAIVLEP